MVTLPRGAHLSIFQKIFFGTVGIIVLIISVSSVVSIVHLRGIELRQAASSASRLAGYVNAGFQQNLDQVDRISMSIYAETQGGSEATGMQNILASPRYSGIADEYSAIRTMGNFFQRMIFLRYDLNSIYLYVSKDKSYSYTVNGRAKLEYSPVGEAWFNQVVALDGKTFISEPHLPYQLDYDRQVISFGRLLRQTGATNDSITLVLLIDLTLQSIDDIMARSLPEGSHATVVFLNRDRRVIYAYGIGAGGLRNTRFPDGAEGGGGAPPRVTSKVTVSGRAYLAAEETLPATGWRLYVLTPYDDATRETRTVIGFNVLIVLLAFVLSVGMAYAFSRVVSNPIKLMHEGMERVKAGDFTTQLERASDDELGRLVENFNSMITTIRTLHVEKNAEEIARRDAEYRNLQAQINPHFIYNTLQLISSMSIVLKVPDINVVVKNLGKMMRYNIGNDGKPVSIREEIEALTAYLEIQKSRFGNELDYRLTADETALGCEVPRLVLQPIVENAIDHGIEPKGSRGIVELSAVKADSVLVIEVRDDGVGMSPVRLSEVRAALAAHGEAPAVSLQLQSRNSVALHNIDLRIKLYYGNAFGLQIESVESRWTKVTLRLPAVDARNVP